MKKYSFFIVLLLLLCSCISPEPRKPVSYSSSSFIQESVERNRKINALQEAAIKYYIAQDSLNKYQTSTHGFWYAYLNQKNDNKYTPVIGNEVEFQYEISDLSNQVLYTMNDLGLSHYVIDKEDFESGIQNGLKLMKEGEEVKFLFPSFAAFGYAGDQEKIGVNQPLIYKVKLIKIKKRNESN